MVAIYDSVIFASCGIFAGVLVFVLERAVGFARERLLQDKEVVLVSCVLSFTTSIKPLFHDEDLDEKWVANIMYSKCMPLSNPKCSPHPLPTLRL
jgi:hypothetical protein